MSDTTAQTTAQIEPTSFEPAKELSQLEQIDNLLAGKPEKPEKAPDAAEPGREPNIADHDGSTQKAEPETAEPEAVTEDEEQGGIDYTQEVPLSNGEKMSIGALKDHYQAFAQKELALIERENTVMARHGELQELAQYMQLPPEKLQQIAQEQTEHLREQHVQMLEAIPEWKDKANFERDRGRIFELGKEYRVDLSRVTDHRVVKMLNDFARLRASIKDAKANVKQVKGKEPKPVVRAPRVNGSELQQRIDRAKATGNQADQMIAVDMLLKG